MTQPETHAVDTLVIGAGVIGLATARALARAGRDVIVVDTEPAIAAHTSSRNSEVIHAGLYYPEGSNKARFCVEGRRALVACLDERGIARKACGKLVVALDTGEEDALKALHSRALANDVEGLSLIDGDAARRLEPALSRDCVAALHSEVSGIFDSHGYVLALQADLEAEGGQVVLGTPILGGRVTAGAIELDTGGAEPVRLAARRVVNAAGHHAVALASRIEGGHDAPLPVPRYAKGHYFSITGRTPFSRLIYPMPGRASLGLHLTVDLGGRGKLGPDVEWLPEGAGPPFDYAVDASRAGQFEAAARRYWPGLPDDALAPDYAGVRPKLVGPGEPSGDFRFDVAAEGRIVHLFGIESPGLTASLAIAGHVANLLA